MRELTLAPVADAGWSNHRLRLDPARVLQIALFFMLGANIVRVPLLSVERSQAPLGINDIAVVLVLAAGGLAMLRTRSMRLNNVALGALLFVAIGGLSAVAGVPRFGLSLHELTVSLAYLARWVVYFGIYVVVINCARARDVRPLWTALEWTMLLFAAFGIVQSIFFPSFFEMFRGDNLRPYVDYDPQGSRLVSTVLEPNVAAAMILTVLLVQIALISQGVRVRGWKPVLLLAALALTISRSGLLGLLVGGLVIVTARGLTKRLARFLVPVAILVAAFMPKILEYAASFGKTGFSDSSAMARLVVWARAFATFLDHPWFGIGFNTYAFVQARRGYEVMNNSSYSVEGGLLFVAVMTGVVGLAAYSLMLWFVWRQCRRTWRDPDATPEQRGFSIGAAAVTAAIVVHSTFVNSLLVPFVMEPLWILWGFAFLLRTPQRARAAISSAEYRMVSAA